ncbi:hypothetical protein D3C79_874540 [compost metagenome]
MVIGNTGSAPSSGRPVDGKGVGLCSVWEVCCGETADSVTAVCCATDPLDTARVADGKYTASSLCAVAAGCANAARVSISS